MVGSKLSKCATKLDHCICRAYQRHGCGDDDDCKTNCFYEKIVSCFILKILTADVSKTRCPGFNASSPVPFKRHRTIIAVNQREPVALSSYYRDRLHSSFSVCSATVIAKSMPTKRTTLQDALADRLSFIERITGVFNQSRSGTVPSQDWDGFQRSD